MDIATFFDGLYASSDRYWWHEDTRYATDPEAHGTSLVTQMTLRLLSGRSKGRALDLGAGEGADSIRLARLGYSVDAVEISEVGAGKIKKLAAEAGVEVNVEIADVGSYEPTGYFDIIMCNGVLHYIDDKASVVERMQEATRVGGINVVSLWSTFTPVPDCHNQVPVYCDGEHGIISKLYEDWNKELFYLERGKPESSHSGMPEHSHSHIKMIARKRAN